MLRDWMTAKPVGTEGTAYLATAELCGRGDRIQLHRCNEGSTCLASSVGCWGGGAVADGKDAVKLGGERRSQISELYSLYKDRHCP